MNDEQQNLRKSRPDTAPPQLGWTVLVQTDADASELIDRFVLVWNVVASWGTWQDQADDWPEDRLLLKQLPAWFSQRLNADHAVDISNWLDDLHDRSWAVWSLAAQGDRIKLDLSSGSLPLSAWPALLVWEVVGGRVLFSDTWTAGFHGGETSPSMPRSR